MATSGRTVLLNKVVALKRSLREKVNSILKDVVQDQEREGEKGSHQHNND